MIAWFVLIYSRAGGNFREFVARDGALVRMPNGDGMVLRKSVLEPFFD